MASGTKSSKEFLDFSAFLFLSLYCVLSNRGTQNKNIIILNHLSLYRLYVMWFQTVVLLLVTSDFVQLDLDLFLYALKCLKSTTSRLFSLTYTLCIYLYVVFIFTLMFLGIVG